MTKAFLGICVFPCMCTARSSCHASPDSTNLACIAGFEAEKILVKRACKLKAGYYFLASRVWQSSAGISYDNHFLTPRGAEGCAPRAPWKRLSFNFPLKGGSRQRLDIHRVLAFNNSCCNSSETTLLEIVGPCVPLSARSCSLEEVPLQAHGGDDGKDSKRMAQQS